MCGALDLINTIEWAEVDPHLLAKERARQNKDGLRGQLVGASWLSDEDFSLALECPFFPCPQE